jgi:hypothetical protein
VLYLLLTGLMTVPLIGSVLALLAGQFQITRRSQHYLNIAAITIALLCAWLVRPAQMETIFGNWSPVSFTGMPLILSLNPEGITVLIGVALAMLSSLVIVRHTGREAIQAVTGALLFGALCVTALAFNLVTLAVGIGLVDLLVAVSGLLISRQPARVLRDALFHFASLALLFIAIALYDAAGNSLYLPLAHLTSNLMPFIAGALVLRFSLLPLRAISDMQNEGSWFDKASPIAGLILVARLSQYGAPELRAWFFGLVLITALFALLLGTLTGSRSRLQASVEIGALAFALLASATWQTAPVIVAAVAWLLGATLVGQNAGTFPLRFRRIVLLLRLVGLLCLVGLPLTMGFIGRAGISATWSGRGLGGLVLIVGLAVAQALLTLCTLRLTLWSDAPSSQEPASPSNYLAVVVLAVLSLHIIVFGVFSRLAGAPSLGDQLAANRLSGWLIWLLPTLVGTAGWWFETRWLHLLTGMSARLSQVIGLNWWQSTVSGALNRIAQPLGSVFVFLESDGALLWAVIVILIVVLVSRPGGP